MKDVRFKLIIDTKSYERWLSDFFTYAMLSVVTLDVDYADALVRLINSHSNEVFYSEYRQVIIEMTSIRSQVFN
jgi:hypothetical protein